MCAIFGLWIKLRKSSFACCGWHLPFPTLGYATILFTRNQMIFLVQFGINKHLLIFSKTTNCTRPTGSCNFVSLWKNLLVLIYSKLHSKSCDYLFKGVWWVHVTLWRLTSWFPCGPSRGYLVLVMGQVKPALEIKHIFLPLSFAMVYGMCSLATSDTTFIRLRGN